MAPLWWQYSKACHRKHGSCPIGEQYTVHSILQTRWYNGRRRQDSKVKQQHAALNEQNQFILTTLTWTETFKLTNIYQWLKLWFKFQTVFPCKTLTSGHAAICSDPHDSPSHLVSNGLKCSSEWLTFLLRNRIPTFFLITQNVDFSAS